MKLVGLVGCGAWGELPPISGAIVASLTSTHAAVVRELVVRTIARFLELAQRRR